MIRATEFSGAVERAAPAKLNLYLHVIGRREDGYHLLDSLVAFADIGDRVIARASDRLSLTVEGPFAATLQGPQADNLIWRTARALAARAGIEPKAALTLDKNLPVASGIGGGSSDAAATLSALAELWELDLNDARFADLASSLGADVPVCLYGKTAWLGGIGEQIVPAFALPPVAVVLVNPGIPLPTPAVFKARNGAFSNTARFEDVPRDASALAVLLHERRNDLAEPAIRLAPVIAEVLRALEETDGALLARVSGSGATCFALFETMAIAEVAAAELRDSHLGWWVASGRLL